MLGRAGCVPYWVSEKCARGRLICTVRSRPGAFQWARPHCDRPSNQPAAHGGAGGTLRPVEGLRQPSWAGLRQWSRLLAARRLNQWYDCAAAAPRLSWADGNCHARV